MVTKRPGWPARLAFSSVARSGDPPVEVIAVTKSQDGRVVMRNATFRCRRGEPWALVGANGSGKTTLLRLLLGNEQPDSGVIRVASKARCGYYAQEAESLDADRSAVDLCLEVCGERRWCRTTAAFSTSAPATGLSWTAAVQMPPDVRGIRSVVRIMRTLFLLALACASLLLAEPPRDPRHIENGFEIPDENYADQPYVVATNDGKWLCVLTTGIGKEGAPGQHIVSTISSDHGRTWTPPSDIEPASGPEASWVMPLKVPYGRIYVFYNYNRDNVRLLVHTKSERLRRRVDTIGVYAFKYSDDNGRTWSKERYEIPMRKMRIDRENLDSGAILYFWGVGKPIVTPRYAIFGFAKVGKWDDPGGMVESEGCFLRSDNILTERDPRKLVWQLLPDGDEGLRAPKGAVSDEANLVALSDGSLYATYRTIDGYSCHAYSRDGGHTWTPPAYATYSPGGRPIKHNRAATFVRKFSNGKYLLWYHNHGGEQFHVKALNHYLGRNPSWLAGGIEQNGLIQWSEPEIVLYNDDPLVGSSYPDFIEEGGRYFITETQKTVARVHEVDPTLLKGLWNQQQNRSVAQRGLVLDLAGQHVKAGATVPMPKLASLAERGGFAVDFWIKLTELTAGQSILDTRDASGKGIALVTSDRSTIKLIVNDSQSAFEWDSDAGTHPGTLKVNAWQHVAVIVDAGPRIVSFLVDGVFNDGGALREYGWGRFPKELGDVNAADARVAGKLFGQLARLRIYNRYLRTSEAVGNWRAGR